MKQLQYNKAIIDIIKNKLSEKRTSSHDVRVLLQMLEWFVVKLDECDGIIFDDGWKNYFGVNDDRST